MIARGFVPYGGVALVLSSVCISELAWADSWGSPSREFARYGVRTIVCHTAGHSRVCLGLACRNGSLELVNAAGGGGPIEGPTRVFNGRRSAFSLNFVFDPKAIDRLGLAASRAIVSAQQLSTLEGASQVSLTAGDDPSIQHRFSTKGQTREWRKAREICASSRADPKRSDANEPDAWRAALAAHKQHEQAP